MAVVVSEATWSELVKKEVEQQDGASIALKALRKKVVKKAAKTLKGGAAADGDAAEAQLKALRKAFNAALPTLACVRVGADEQVSLAPAVDAKADKKAEKKAEKKRKAAAAAAAAAGGGAPAPASVSEEAPKPKKAKKAKQAEVAPDELATSVNEQVSLASRRGGTAAAVAWREKNMVRVSEAETFPPMTSWDIAAAALPESLVGQCRAAGFAAPSPIQAQAWPPLVAGRDVVAVAETGSGKTLGFSLPALAALIKDGKQAKPRTPAPAMLVLSPTRELAIQSADVIIKVRRRAR